MDDAGFPTGSGTVPRVSNVVTRLAVVVLLPLALISYVLARALMRRSPVHPVRSAGTGIRTARGRYLDLLDEFDAERARMRRSFGSELRDEALASFLGRGRI